MLRLFLSALFCLFLAPAVFADPLILIDFETPPGVYGYRPQGVSLVSVNTDLNGNIVNIADLNILPFGSANHAAFGHQANPLANRINGISGQFVFNIQEGIFVPATTSFVSFDVVATEAPWTVYFYDSTNGSEFDAHTGIIGTVTGTGSSTVVFAAIEIRRFLFLPSAPNTLPGIDNLQYATTAVPEPATLLLLAVGLAAIKVLRPNDHSR